MAHSRGYNRGAVILRHLLVGSVQDGLIPGILCNAGLEIVRDQQPCHTSEVIVGMDMTGYPVLQPHIVASLSIGEAAAGQDGNEQIRLADLSGDRTMDVQRITDPVNLHGVTGLMLDATATTT